MIKAILPCSISELGAKRPERAEGERLWDRNSPLHICVYLTQMYVLQVSYLGASRPASRLYRGEATI